MCVCNCNATKIQILKNWINLIIRFAIRIAETMEREKKDKRKTFPNNPNNSLEISSPIIYRQMVAVLRENAGIFCVLSLSAHARALSRRGWSLIVRWKNSLGVGQFAKMPALLSLSLSHLFPLLHFVIDLPALYSLALIWSQGKFVIYAFYFTPDASSFIADDQSSLSYPFLSDHLHQFFPYPCRLPWILYNLFIYSLLFTFSFSIHSVLSQIQSAFMFGSPYPHLYQGSFSPPHFGSL